VIRIFVGYDPREAVAYHVLCHSILARASVPVTIAPLAPRTLGAPPAARKNLVAHDPQNTETEIAILQHTYGDPYFDACGRHSDGNLWSAARDRMLAGASGANALPKAG
jgi:hypothetical protein